METPRYITATLAEHEANLVIAGLLRVGLDLRGKLLDGGNQGMCDAQMDALRRSIAVNSALLQRITEAMP
jgi:hypothetical protein